jgi:hypothetical protein
VAMGCIHRHGFCFRCPRENHRRADKTGTAAATLSRLFFVAFSLRVRDLQLSLALRTRERYPLTWLIAITARSAFVAMPGQSRTVLAAGILVGSVCCAAYAVWSVLRSAGREQPPPLSTNLIGRWLGIGATWLLIGSRL